MAAIDRLDPVVICGIRAGRPARALLWAAGVALALSLSPATSATRAAAPEDWAPQKPLRMGNETSKEKEEEIHSLHEAYLLIASADHDYGGRRIRAMGSIERACDVLGSDIRGDGKGHEPQHLSDKELRRAKEIVEHVREMAERHEQDVVVEHLDGAIRHLNEALKAK